MSDWEEFCVKVVGWVTGPHEDCRGKGQPAPKVGDFYWSGWPVGSESWKQAVERGTFTTVWGVMKVEVVKPRPAFQLEEEM